MKALILVDLQNDFLPGGALPVKDGHKVIPMANRLLNLPFDLKLATKDWHPADHGSFAATHGKKPGEVIQLGGIKQILWPVHCVQNTKGADFAQELDRKKIDKVFLKGTDKLIDSYSTFFDNDHHKSTGLDKYLKEKNVDTVFIAGLATDYCVLYSVLDACKLGLKTHVIADACRGIDLNPGDVQKALDAMQSAGARIITMRDLIKHEDAKN